METEQLGVANDTEKVVVIEEDDDESSSKKQKITQVSEILVDKVKSTTPNFQIDTSIGNLGLHAVHLKTQSSNSPNISTSTIAESSKNTNGKKPLFISEISGVELKKMSTYFSVKKDPFKKKEHQILKTVKVASEGISTNNNPKAKKRSIGIKRQKSGRYGAVIRDPIRHKQVWLGTFDTVEEASKAYFSKKSQFDDEKLSILQPVVANDQALNTAKPTRMLGAYRKKGCKNYVSEIKNPITKKKVWLGTFATAEEASQAFQSKKLEFQKLVELKQQHQQQCNNNEKIHDSKLDRKVELVNVLKQGHENESCERFQLEQRVTVDEKEDEEISSCKEQKITQSVVKPDDSDADADAAACQERRSSSVEQQPERAVTKIFVDKVKSRTRFQHNQRDSSTTILGLPATEVNAQRSNSTKRTSATENITPKTKRGLIGIRRQKSGRYAAEITDRIRHKKIWLGTFDTVEEASKAYFSKKSELDEKLISLQGNNKENKPKKNCDQINQESPATVSSSVSVPIDQTFDTASVGMDFHKARLFFGVKKSKTTGKYSCEITNPISKKKIWLGTFATAEEASQAYQSKKLEFQRLVKAKQQLNNQQTHDSKQDGKEKLVDVNEGQEYENCERFHPEVAGGLENEKGVLAEEIEETSNNKQKINQVINSDDLDVSSREGQERRSPPVEQQPGSDISEIFVDKVKSSTPFQHCQIDSSRVSLGFHATELKIRNSSSTNSTTAAESRTKADDKRPFIREISRDELMTNVHVRASSKSTSINPNHVRASSKPTSINPNHVRASSKSTSINPKAKISLIGIRRAKNGRYGAVIRDPFKRKQIWLGTFDTPEEVSEAYFSKKSEFEQLSLQGNKPKIIHDSKQDGKEKSVNVKSGHENVHCERVQPESAGGSEIDVPIANSSNGGTDQRIDSHEIGTTEEVFGAFQSSKKVELQSNMPTNLNQQGEADEHLRMEQWVQLPGDREVKFSQELGLPIIDNYGTLLGEFSSLDDLDIC